MIFIDQGEFFLETPKDVFFAGGGFLSEGGFGQMGFWLEGGGLPEGGFGRRGGGDLSCSPFFGSK